MLFHIDPGACEVTMIRGIAEKSRRLLHRLRFMSRHPLPVLRDDWARLKWRFGARKAGFVREKLLNVGITTICTLRCAECANLVPYRPGVSGDADDIIADIFRLADIARFRYAAIQGGEPLLHLDLGRIIEAAYESGIASSVVVVTNGTCRIAPDLIGICKKANVFFRISYYGPRRQAVENFVAQCNKEGLWYGLDDFTGGGHVWLSMGGPGFPENEDARAVQRIFRTCAFNRCWTLEDGRLTRCARAAGGASAGLHPFFPDDFVEIRTGDQATLGERLRRFVSRTTPLGACRYCYGTTGSVIVPGEQLTGTEANAAMPL